MPTSVAAQTPPRQPAESQIPAAPQVPDNKSVQHTKPVRPSQQPSDEPQRPAAQTSTQAPPASPASLQTLARSPRFSYAHALKGSSTTAVATMPAPAAVSSEGAPRPNLGAVPKDGSGVSPSKQNPVAGQPDPVPHGNQRPLPPVPTSAPSTQPAVPPLSKDSRRHPGNQQQLPASRRRPTTPSRRNSTGNGSKGKTPKKKQGPKNAPSPRKIAPSTHSGNSAALHRRSSASKRGEQVAGGSRSRCSSPDHVPSVPSRATEEELNMRLLEIVKEEKRRVRALEEKKKLTDEVIKAHDDGEYS